MSDAMPMRLEGWRSVAERLGFHIMQQREGAAYGMYYLASPDGWNWTGRFSFDPEALWRDAIESGAIAQWVTDREGIQ